MKEFEKHAAKALESILNEIPIIKLEGMEIEAPMGRHHADILVRLKASNHTHVLVCEVKSSGQPRYVRDGILQLRNYVAHSNIQATPVFIAPYLSPEARMLCRENEVCFVDLQGNVRLEFDGVFIERIVSNKPPSERRQLKSLFRPKSAQVLKMMLHDPDRKWRVEDSQSQLKSVLDTSVTCARAYWTENGLRSRILACFFLNPMLCLTLGAMPTNLKTKSA